DLRKWGPFSDFAETLTLRTTSWASSDTLLTLMLNWTSTCGCTCHWKTAGLLGLSTDKSLIYWVNTAICGSPSGSEPGFWLLESWSAICRFVLELFRAAAEAPKPLGKLERRD